MEKGGHKMNEIIIRPGREQFFSDNFVWMMSYVILFVLCFLPMTKYTLLIATIFTAIVTLRLFAAFLILHNLSYQITSERIIRTQGVFSKVTDYTELFRVIDVGHYQTFLQRIFGVGTIIISSSDRSNPYLAIIGVKEIGETIKFLQENVKKQRIENKIHEIPNL